MGERPRDDEVARWRHVRALFDEAVQRPDTERSAYLAAACAGDDALRAEVQALLAADAGAHPLLDATPVQLADAIRLSMTGEGSRVPGAAPPPIAAGERFGSYEVEREVGHGGMATVYLARDRKHARRVALKVLAGAAALTPTGAERFAREIRTAARLQHPHICPVLDSGESAGRLWYAMPFVDGESLRDRLRRESPLDVPTARRILQEAAQALQVAHGEGIVHRDIKPENLLLTRDGATLVADFGIARGLQLAEGDERGEAVAGLTATGMLVGTPAYMSPEQLDEAEAVSAASDQYALALVGYEMLAGRHPFANADGTLPRRRARREAPPPPLHAVRPAVPRVLSEAIARAMREAPGDRFPSIADFAQSLARDGTTEGAGAPSPLPANGSIPASRWGAATWLAAGVALLAVAASAIVTVRGRNGAVGESTATKTLAETSVTRAAAVEDVESGSETPRLVVLPFDNVGEPGDAYFADGVSDAIRATLASGTGVEVVARASSMSLRASGLGAEGAARELGARYLLTGTVRWARGEARVVINPALVEVVRGVAVTRWEESITTPLADVFAVQAQIAVRVAAATHAALGLLGRGGGTEPPTRDLGAYDDFLAGEAASQGGTVIDVPSLQRAEAKYASAVVRDSTFGAAWARLALVRGFLLSRVPLTASGVAAARRALAMARRLAPGDASTPFAESLIARFVDNDRARALAVARAGLRDHPTDALLLSHGAILELVAGRPDTALAMLQLARRLDPRNPGVWWRLAHVQAWRRQWDDADLASARGLALAPGNMQLLLWRVMAAIGRGDAARARSVVDSALASPAMRPELLLPYIAETFELWWILDARQREMLLTLGDSDFDSPASRAFVRAQLLAARGDSGAAAAEARRAIPLLARDTAQLPELGAQLAAMLVLAGRSHDGVRIAERALQRIRAAGDRQFGPSQAFIAAIALAWGGAHDRAIDELASLLAQPVFVSREWMRIDPRLAPLRQEVRFRRLVGAADGP